MKPAKRERPTLRMLRGLHGQNMKLVAERQDLYGQVMSLQRALEEEASRSSSLATERRIAEERLVEVQTHLSDLRTVLGLPAPLAVDAVKFLRNTLAEKLGRPS